MSEEAELASPAAAIVARRESRMPERLKVSAPDDSPDDDWDPEEGAGATDEEDSDAEDSGADGGAKKKQKSRRPDPLCLYFSDPRVLPLRRRYTMVHVP